MSSSAPSTTAPAPSPNRMQVRRSSQSIRRDSVSAPMTSARLIWPLRMKALAVAKAYMKPAQTACTSKAGTPARPRRSCTTTAVLGKTMSGVVVATMIISIDAASMPAASMARRAARYARSLVSWPSAARRRSWMPVRLTIHSSVVSTRLASSVLVRMVSGR